MVKNLDQEVINLKLEMIQMKSVIQQMPMTLKRQTYKIQDICLKYTITKNTILMIQMKTPQQQKVSQVSISANSALSSLPTLLIYRSTLKKIFLCFIQAPILLTFKGVLVRFCESFVQVCKQLYINYYQFLSPLFPDLLRA